MNKIEVIKEELQGYQLAFKSLNKDLEKYKILGEEQKIKDTKDLLNRCADKVVHYTALLYKEEHGEVKEDFKTIRDDTAKVFEKINKTFENINKSLDKINKKLDRLGGE